MQLKKKHSLVQRKIALMALSMIFVASRGNAGKPKGKPALLAASQVSGIGSETSKVSNVDFSEKEYRSPLHNATLSASHLLKNYLMENYDKSLRPVINHTDNVNIKVGFTFRQETSPLRCRAFLLNHSPIGRGISYEYGVQEQTADHFINDCTIGYHWTVHRLEQKILDLDEKNQVLNSLIWFRMSWKDQYLTWEPDDFNGIEEIELPYYTIWKPDIVVYEEIGKKSYGPRLQNAMVTHDGTVTCHEPVAYETTCRIDTAFFPFDVQICYMTFVSWTENVRYIDLISDRSTKKFFDDTKHYFINTGEWKLAGIDVGKVARDYGDLLSTAASKRVDAKVMDEQSTVSTTNMSSRNSSEKTPLSWRASEKKIKRSPYMQHHNMIFPMSPQALINYTTLGNNSVKPNMYAEIKYTIVVRRNSSLYIQSMLLPAILLTTVAILGFYLPPDSGERIGLQITILLSFMVFLLAVGEMFPASTGPYLGLYFVLCMALLGINLGMTVVVLHLHFKPVILQDPELDRKIKRRNFLKSKSQEKNTTRCCMSFKHKIDPPEIHLTAPPKRETTVVPKRLQNFLKFCDRYWSLKEHNARWLHDVSDDQTSSGTVDEHTEDELTSVGEESSSSLYYGRRNTIESRTNRVKIESETVVDKENLPNYQQFATRLTDNRLDIPYAVNIHRKSLSDSNLSQLPPLAEDKKDPLSPKLGGSKSCEVDQPLDPIGLSMFTSMTLGNMKKHTNSNDKKTSDGKLSKRAGLNGIKCSNKDYNSSTHKSNHKTGEPSDSANILRFKVMGAINDLKKYMKKNEKKNRPKRKSDKQKKKELKVKLKEKEQERQDMEQEEWKSVARAIDVLFFRLYVFLILISHLWIFGTALKTWFADHDITYLEHTT